MAACSQQRTAMTSRPSLRSTPPTLSRSSRSTTITPSRSDRADDKVIGTLDGGRGGETRALWDPTGKVIATTTATQACRFTTGPCPNTVGSAEPDRPALGRPQPQPTHPDRSPRVVPRDPPAETASELFPTFSDDGRYVSVIDKVSSDSERLRHHDRASTVDSRARRAGPPGRPSRRTTQPWPSRTATPLRLASRCSTPNMVAPGHGTRDQQHLRSGLRPRRKGLSRRPQARQGRRGQRNAAFGTPGAVRAARRAHADPGLLAMLVIPSPDGTPPPHRHRQRHDRHLGPRHPPLGGPRLPHHPVATSHRGRMARVPPRPALPPHLLRMASRRLSTSAHPTENHLLATTAATTPTHTARAAAHATIRCAAPKRRGSVAGPTRRAGSIRSARIAGRSAPWPEPSVES